MRDILPLVVDPDPAQVAEWAEKSPWRWISRPPTPEEVRDHSALRNGAWLTLDRETGHVALSYMWENMGRLFLVSLAFAEHDAPLEEGDYLHVPVTVNKVGADFLITKLFFDRGLCADRLGGAEISVCEASFPADARPYASYGQRHLEAQMAYMYNRVSNLREFATVGGDL